MMKREDALYAMNGTTLIQVADKLGVKVSCNRTRTALKEKKADVVQRILAAESAASELEAKEESPVVSEKETAKIPEKKTTKKQTSESEIVDSVLDIVIEFLEKYPTIPYKRSRDGVAITRLVNGREKKRLDMWKRKNSIRIYLNADNEEFYKTLDFDSLVERFDYTSGAIAKQFNISIYVNRANIETVLSHLLGL